MSSNRRTVNILGVTGSVGRAAVDVIAANADRFMVNVVTAHMDEAGLQACAKRLGARHAVLTARERPDAALAQPVDITLCAIAGMAGLESMMQAIRHSGVVAVANKEPLVAAGSLVMAEAQKHGTQILPVDSEHNAIFQVFDFKNREGIEKIILTASGGPFLRWSAAEMERATPAQALAHPNWTMGRKISVDSATMMNKALEVIEAHYLFGLPPEKIEVLVHPQSVIHSMVEYADGSVLSQMGASDMRTPVAHALAWPGRMSTPGARLNFKEISQLTFEEPDTVRFPALGLAYECLRAGPYACIALNAANEVAVDGFLTNRIGFLDIMRCIEHILGALNPGPLESLQSIIDYDSAVRRQAQDWVQGHHSTKAVSAL